MKAFSVDEDLFYSEDLHGFEVCGNMLQEFVSDVYAFVAMYDTDVGADRKQL